MTLPNAVTGSPVTVTLANGEVITIGIGATSGSVTTTPADNVYAGSSTVTNSIASISGGNFEHLVASGATISTTVTDEPSPTSPRSACRRRRASPKAAASFTPPRSPTPHRPRSP